MQRLCSFRNVQNLLIFYNCWRKFSCRDQTITFLGYFAIVLDFPRLRTGTTIVIYGAWLDSSNSSASRTSVLSISAATISTLMTSVVGGVRGVVCRGWKACHPMRNCNWRRKGLNRCWQFVCLQWVRSKPGLAFSHWFKWVDRNVRRDLIQIEICNWTKHSLQRARLLPHPIFYNCLVEYSALSMKYLLRLLTWFISLFLIARCEKLFLFGFKSNVTRRQIRRRSNISCLHESCPRLWDLLYNKDKKHPCKVKKRLLQSVRFTDLFYQFNTMKTHFYFENSWGCDIQRSRNASTCRVGNSLLKLTPDD